nr:MAG TPA: hypothetical protein [Caudoviricetes sp.]
MLNKFSVYLPTVIDCHFNRLANTVRRYSISLSLFHLYNLF